MGICSPDADEFSTLNTGVATDNGPAKFSGGIVGENENLVVFTGLDGTGERRFQILRYFYLLGVHYPFNGHFCVCKVSQIFGISFKMKKIIVEFTFFFLRMIKLLKNCCVKRAEF